MPSWANHDAFFAPDQTTFLAKCVTRFLLYKLSSLLSEIKTSHPIPDRPHRAQNLPPKEISGDFTIKYGDLDGFRMF